MMAHDQFHEQLNATVKGIIGITENESALKRWMVAGPETARIINELSMVHSTKVKCHDSHHEQTPSIQNRFAAHVRHVVDVFNDMGNPFTETSSDLFAIDTKIIMSDEVIQSIKTKAEDIGKEQYRTFVDERMIKITKPSHDTIPKSNFTMFKSG